MIKKPVEEVAQGTDEGLDPEGRARRSMLSAATTLAGLALLSSKPALSADDDGKKLPVQAGDKMMITKGKLKNNLLKPDMMKVAGRPLTVYPYDAATKTLRKKYRLNRILVLRLAPDEMNDETRALSVEGVVAYSAICTHKACTINSWKEKQRHLRCHCHLSEFAALNKGKVMSGPAQASLPMVPLALDEDGVVVAREGFNKKPGSKTA